MIEWLKRLWRRLRGKQEQGLWFAVVASHDGEKHDVPRLHSFPIRFMPCRWGRQIAYAPEEQPREVYGHPFRLSPGNASETKIADLPEWQIRPPYGRTTDFLITAFQEDFGVTFKRFFEYPGYPPPEDDDGKENDDSDQ